MPVIAGTNKESVINRAREVLREKEIPYTIKRTKTWFFISSPKPATAQKALIEAGLEMNPITTMHSVWCTKCNAISKFEKSTGKTWKCQKCGAKISVVNPGYEWHSAYPFKPGPKGLVVCGYCKRDMKYLGTAKGKSGSRYEMYMCPKCGRVTAGRVPIQHYLNPIKKTKAMVHPEAIESLARYKDDLKAGHTSAAEYWRGQAGAYFTANPFEKDRMVKIARHTWQVIGGDVAQSSTGSSEALVSRKVVIDSVGDFFGTGQSDYRKLFREWMSLTPKQRNEILSEAFPEGQKYNPLTKTEKQEIVNLANTQFAISRKYADQPVRSSFWYGRSVGMGKIAKMYNPKWDPISEILEGGEEEEDKMIGAEINPLSIRQRERVVAKYSAQLEAVKRATIGLIGDRVKTIDSSRLYARTVDQAKRLGENAPSWPLFVELVRFIGGKFSKTDKKIIIILPTRKNPLAAIGSAAITGVGLGIGFKSVDWMAKKIKKNPPRSRR